MSYLLDTNILIGILRGVRSYWDYIEKLLEQTLPSISTVSRTEVYAGCHPEEERDTRMLLECFTAVPIDSSIADRAGQYVYQYGRRGLTLHVEDALIGATAVKEGLILVTQNISHFPMLSLNQNLGQFPTH